LDFGLFIAYLVPGFVAFYALTYFSLEVSDVFTSSLAPHSGITAELGIGLFSIGAGIIVSALRDMALDKIQICTSSINTEIDYSKLADKDKMEAFKGVIENLYRYTQFYGNMFVSLLVLIGARLFSAPQSAILTAVNILLLVALIVLFIAHRRSLGQTYLRIGQILS